jgi:hypothetical protein
MVGSPYTETAKAGLREEASIIKRTKMARDGDNLVSRIREIPA